MRELSIEVTEDTFEALEVERSLIGFKSRSAYLRWIIDNRAGIDQGTQPDWLVDAYHQRISELESGAESDRPEGRANATAGRSESEANANAGRAGAESNADAGRSESEPNVGTSGPMTHQRQLDDVLRAPDPSAADAGERTGSAPGSGHSTEAAADAESGTAVTPSDTGEDGAGRGPGASASRSGDGLELRGKVGKTTVERGSEAASGAGKTGRPGADRSGTDAVRAAGDGTAGGIDSVHLTPERIERIREDAISKDAGLLGSVKVDRVDELSRRAVAKTRKRLNRDVQTGLEYVSSTALADETVRPGEDVVDLDALSVPGRSEAVEERRREAAGRAVAFLRDEGRARKSDFVEALYDEVPAGYDTADGWWRCVKDALKQVDAVDGGDGSRVWRYDG